MRARRRRSWWKCTRTGARRRASTAPLPAGHSGGWATQSPRGRCVARTRFGPCPRSPRRSCASSASSRWMRFPHSWTSSRSSGLWRRCPSARKHCSSGCSSSTRTSTGSQTRGRSSPRRCPLRDCDSSAAARGRTSPSGSCTNTACAGTSAFRRPRCRLRSTSRRCSSSRRAQRAWAA